MDQDCSGDARRLKACSIRWGEATSEAVWTKPERQLVRFLERGQQSGTVEIHASSVGAWGADKPRSVRHEVASPLVVYEPVEVVSPTAAVEHEPGCSPGESTMI